MCAKIARAPAIFSLKKLFIIVYIHLIIFYRGHLDVHRSSVEDPRASIKEKQHKHAKNVAGALKKRRTGKGNVKKLVNFPGKHFRSCIFLHLNGILMHLQLHLQCTGEIIF